ncbi:MAG: hypothetical protein AAFY19_00695 [Pseudomonadota bacterium]
MTPWQFKRWAAARGDRRIDDLNFMIHATFKGAIAQRAKRPDLSKLLIDKPTRGRPRAQSRAEFIANVRQVFG